MSHKGTDENFVVFGTAFPEQTERDKRAGRTDSGQFVPSWKQEVRDEHGRRRFHGAFTGGFSAGYFNTVGSKEGWEPSNYVSSRTARNERKEAKPEDFMDEEDLQDLAGAQKLVATEEFDVFGSTERELAERRRWMQQQEEKGSGMELIGHSLINMLGPPRDSVGVRLLRKMGWRPGQGIGPRMRRRRLSDASSASEDDDVTFAPRDMPIEDYRVKRDSYGLGYDLATHVPEVAEMKRLREMAATKKANENRAMFGVYEGSTRNKDAFGLGALETAEDEDEDIYGNTMPMNQYHTSLYDDDDTPSMTRPSNQQRQRQQQQKVNQQTCSDGRPPLPGFHLSVKGQNVIGKWYAPPQVPATFTGYHVTTEEQETKPELVNKESVFSFEERGHILGEKPIETRSVFDYMPQHSKDKLNKAIDFFIDLGRDKSQLADFATVPKEVAVLALQGFMPFGDHPQKQARYRHYLENQAGKLTEDGIPLKTLPIPEGLTFEAGMKEMDEFAKAARIFRPMSAMMSGRFTSSSLDTSNNQVETIKFEGGLKTEQEYRKEKEAMAKQEASRIQPKPISQEAEAAAMKMFGALTRTVKPFYPNRLVCKRFNVRNPHPEHNQKTDAEASRTQAGSKEALSKESMESMLNKRMPLLPSDGPSDPLLQAVIPKPSERTVEATTLPDEKEQPKQIEEEENEENVTAMDYERPSMNIFKAIFDESDSEEEEEEEEEKRSPVHEQEEKEQDDFIGPPLPPAPATAEIPLTIDTPKLSPTSEPFRPMFKRASERKEQHDKLDVVSEAIVVQPFKPRFTGQKRRQVTDETDNESSSDEHSKKSSHKKKKRKRYDSDEEDKSHRRRRHHHHKSSKKRKRSKSRERKHKSSRKESHSRKAFEDELLDAMWVEKEPPSSKATQGRMRAADMWK